MRAFDEGDHDPQDLSELLQEIRILLPGTQVFLAVLGTLPFDNRFAAVDTTLRRVFAITFLATLLSITCFMAPAAYHRIARPIHHKAEFKVFANGLLKAGLVAWTVAMVLATFLVLSVAEPAWALAGSGFVAIVIAILWWALAIGRWHDRLVPRGAVEQDSTSP